MKHKVKCSMCYNGQVGTLKKEWDETGKRPKWEVSDCENCKGKGKIEIEVVDKRKISKRKDIILPVKY